MFTCISCKVAFETADEQRAHFLTDWHRYNMKRRVANLPPVAAASFNEKVLERREQNAVRTDPRSLACSACNKQFSSENAFRSHVQSKKHRDREAVAARNPKRAEATPAARSNDEQEKDEDEASDMEADSDEADDIEQKLANLRRRIKPTDCLFCARHSETIEQNVGHMSSLHSFFIPDKEILFDLPGLLSYLGEKVAVGNLCLFCPNGGREFGSLEAVRKHMIDKAHCKLAYETEEDRAELVDFYDFCGDSGSENEDEEWEDEDEDVDVKSDEEIIDMADQPKKAKKKSITLASDGLSLTLPSGRTLGHKSLKVYYDQRYRPSTESGVDPSALKVAQVRQRLADPSLALVPVAGGHGAFGKGQELMKARNAGEAKWAKKQGRSFQDIKKREQHKTKVAFIHNSQKHFRDPLSNT
nr:pre-60S factor REI1 [Cryptococcus depauperatus CBS 7855]